jgi:hypothetical protein
MAVLDKDTILDLDLDEPFYSIYGFITLPIKGFILYRGYSTEYSVVSSRPAYYCSLKTASDYARNKNCVLTAFTNAKPLKLMDVRFMKDILREMFRTNTKAKQSQLPVILSFGLCSLQHQCKLAKARFPTLIGTRSMNDLIDSLTENHNEYVEKSGVRIAETTNDAFTMSFLQTLFEGFADGFISPKQYTPFHYEKNYNLNAEIIIFNPEKSQIIQLQNLPKKRYAMPIDEIYSTSNKKINNGIPKDHYDFLLSESLYNKNKHIGGMDTTNNTSNSIEQFPSMEQINMSFDNDPIIQEQWKKGHEAGLYWRNISCLQNGYVTYPPLTVFNWDINDEFGEPTIDILEEDREKIKNNIEEETRITNNSNTINPYDDNVCDMGEVEEIFQKSIRELQNRQKKNKTKHIKRKRINNINNIENNINNIEQITE